GHDDERRLTVDIIELARQYGRYGYRKVAALLRQAGWTINDKRVERIWQREGLKVPHKQPKRGRLWLADGSCIRLRPQQRNHVWSYGERPAAVPQPVVRSHRALWAERMDQRRYRHRSSPLSRRWERPRWWWRWRLRWTRLRLLRHRSCSLQGSGTIRSWTCRMTAARMRRKSNFNQYGSRSVRLRWRYSADRPLTPASVRRQSRRAPQPAGFFFRV